MGWAFRPESQLSAWGQLRMGLALLVVIWLLTFGCSYFFVARTWWPAAASLGGPAIDAQFHYTLIAMGVVFVAAQAGLGLFAWKYRERPGAAAATYSHGNTKLEVVWTALTAILFFGLVIAGAHLWAEERFEPAQPGSVQVEVTGLQFAWYFRYPGPDGKYGRTKPELIDASAGGEAAVGLDSTDPASKDDFVTGTMYLPVDREVDLTLRAQDVIHSFFVPAMRFKQDAVPGLMIHMHFTPDKVGDYEIACAELCGLGHYKMHGILKVVSQKDFDAWTAQREAEKQ
jgi:cytochrome c oxidase subunit II